MLFLLNKDYKQFEIPDYVTTIGDLYEVYWGLPEYSHYQFIGANNETVVVIRPSSINLETRSLKPIEALLVTEAKARKNKKGTATKHLKDTELIVRKNDMLVPLKGKTELIKIETLLEEQPIIFVPNQNYILLRKRPILKNMYWPYINLVTELALETLGTSLYNKKNTAVKGKYGLFNTFTKREIKKQKIKIHTNINIQKSIFGHMSKLRNDMFYYTQLIKMHEDNLKNHLLQID